MALVCLSKLAVGAGSSQHPRHRPRKPGVCVGGSHQGGHLSPGRAPLNPAHRLLLTDLSLL